jgi:hypothetical protein
MKTFKQFVRDQTTRRAAIRAARLSAQRRRQISELIKRLKTVKTPTAHN